MGVVLSGEFAGQFTGVTTGIDRATAVGRERKAIEDLRQAVIAISAGPSRPRRPRGPSRMSAAARAITERPETATTVSKTQGLAASRAPRKLTASRISLYPGSHSPPKATNASQTSWPPNAASAKRRIAIACRSPQHIYTARRQRTPSTGMSRSAAMCNPSFRPRTRGVPRHTDRDGDPTQSACRIRRWCHVTWNVKSVCSGTRPKCAALHSPDFRVLSK